MKNAVAVLLFFVTYWAVCVGFTLLCLGVEWWRYSFALAVAALSVALVLSDRKPGGVS